MIGTRRFAFVVAVMLAVATIGLGGGAASANSSWKTANTSVDVVGGQYVGAQAIGSGLDLVGVRFMASFAQNAEPCVVFWNAQVVGGPNNDWVATWPNDGSGAFVSPTMPSPRNLGGSYYGSPPLNYGYVAAITPNIQTPGGVLTVRFSIAVYSEDPEDPGPFVVDQGSFAFNIFNSTLSPA